MFRKFLIILSLCTFSCSHQTSIGLKNHDFSITPNQIIWIQIPGFMFEHFVLRFYQTPSPIKYSVWNDFKCIGNSWSYNLYNLRPSDRNQTLTQLTANLNLNDSCEDYDQKTLWDYLKSLGYKNLIIEKNSDSSNSLLDSLKCKKDDFLKNTSFLLMGKKFSFIKDFKYYHYQTSKGASEMGKVYLDKTCQSSECIASIKDNLEHSWEKLLSKSKKTFLFIRDFTYQKQLEKKNTLELKQSLFELEKLVKYILEKRTRYPGLLLVLSSINGRHLEFPKQGKKWNDLFKNGKHVLYKNKSLYNNFLSIGGRSENFCGSYNDNSIIDRFLWLNKDINYIKNIKELIPLK